MYHTKTPDQNGWYWVRFDDDYAMCHWNPEDSMPMLMRADPTPHRFRALEPEAVQNVLAWVGPLESPFGEFGSSCAYFDESQYVSAIEMGEALVIQVLDEPGQGNASHNYGIGFIQGKPDQPDHERSMQMYAIRFQNGPVQEFGVNGISNEALLAIVEDRLRGFQSGEFACRENAVALTKLQECMMWLQKRTRDRSARGVEGTMQK